MNSTAEEELKQQEQASSVSYKEDNIIGVNFGNQVAKTKKKGNPSNKSNRTNAIKDIEDIKAAKEWFRNKPERFKANHTSVRNYALFVFACNCARRISDIIKLDISDVVSTNGTIKKKFTVQEKKTHKYAEVFITDSASEALTLYLSARTGMELTSEEFQAHLKEPLFISRIGELKHIHRQTAYMAMKEMAVAIGLPEKGINFAPHGCRKTFAYASIKNNPNDPRVIATLSSSLNHSSEAQTRTYADITSEDIERLYNSVNI